MVLVVPDAGGDLGVSLAALQEYALKPSARDDYIRKYRQFGGPGWRTCDDAMAIATAIIMVSRSKALYDGERAVAAIVDELVRLVPSCAACDEPAGADCPVANEACGACGAGDEDVQACGASGAGDEDVPMLGEEVGEALAVGLFGEGYGEPVAFGDLRVGESVVFSHCGAIFEGEVGAVANGDAVIRSMDRSGTHATTIAAGDVPACVRRPPVTMALRRSWRGNAHVDFEDFSRDTEGPVLGSRCFWAAGIARRDYLMMPNSGGIRWIRGVAYRLPELTWSAAQFYEYTGRFGELVHVRLPEGVDRVRIVVKAQVLCCVVLSQSLGRYSVQCAEWNMQQVEWRWRLCADPLRRARAVRRRRAAHVRRVWRPCPEGGRKASVGGRGAGRRIDHAPGWIAREGRGRRQGHLPVRHAPRSVFGQPHYQGLARI